MDHLEISQQNLLEHLKNEIEVILEQLTLLELLKETTQQEIEELHKQLTPLLLQQESLENHPDKRY